MSKLEKLPILFLSIDTLIKLYIKNEKITFENLGVIVGSKFILSQVLYTHKQIVKIPYSILVDKASYVQKRETIIKYMIEELIIKKYQLGQKEATIYASLGHVNIFVNWLNRNKINRCHSLEEAQMIFLEYTYYLKSSIKSHIFTQGSAHSYQYAALKMFQYIYDDKENQLGTTSPLIKNIRDFTMEKSLAKDQKYHFNFYYKFFHGVADFILNFEKYPFKLSLVAKDIWVMPSPITYVDDNTLKTPKCFNRISGEPYSIAQMETLYNMKAGKAKGLLQYYVSNLQKHNRDFRSYHRVSLAHTALKAYYIIFLSITGMNDSTATTLAWDDEFDIEKETHKFSNIKYRAGNKIVSFQIQNKFVKDFHKYLKLRNYVLDGKLSDLLFFSSKYNMNNIVFRNKIGAYSSIINKEMRKNVDANLPMLHSRQLRINKIHQTIKDNGIIAASQIAQSSINTLLTFYQGESFESSSEQLTQYFHQLNQNIFTTNHQSTKTSIGYCNSYNTPKSQMIFANKAIDCKQQDGCLFCESYAIHGDKNDFQKIYSLEYIILESKYIAKNIEHFEMVYNPLLDRIETICNEAVLLQKISKEELLQVREDVFINQNLHPYWEHKLYSLIAMDVL